MKKMTVTISDSDYYFIQKWLASEDDPENDLNFDAPFMMAGICECATFEDVEVDKHDMS